MDEKHTHPRTPSTDAISINIPAVKILAELGRGGMAIVYQALDTGFNPPRPVAVKVMAAQLSADREFQLRFEREASLVGDFRHDNIVRVHASGEVNQTKYIVMEYLAGGTLANRLQAGAMLNAEALSVGAKLADALAYSHSRGIIHRDFKPGNVLFTGDGNPVLSDFGVAKAVSTSETALTQYGMVIGAERYMAPEQARGEALTDRADVYSFGLTVFEMLTGKPVPPAQRMLRSTAEGASLRAALQHTSPDVALLICRCLLFDPATRPTARECASTLTRASAAESVSAANPRRLIWPAVAAGVVAVVAVIGAAHWRSNQTVPTPTDHVTATPQTATPQPITSPSVVRIAPPTRVPSVSNADPFDGILGRRVPPMAARQIQASEAETSQLDATLQAITHPEKPATTTGPTSIKLLRAVNVADYYPPQAGRLAEQGTAIITICVLPNNELASAQLQRSSGYPLLDEAAVQVARDSSFSAATRDGTPIRACSNLPVNFALRN